jgi:hypothetical protein
VILNKRGDNRDIPTIHESSAALGMIFRQTVEVVEGPTGLDKQHKFDIKKCSAFKDDYSITYSIWKTYLTLNTKILIFSAWDTAMEITSAMQTGQSITTRGCSQNGSPRGRRDIRSCTIKRPVPLKYSTTHIFPNQIFTTSHAARN